MVGVTRQIDWMGWQMHVGPRLGTWSPVVLVQQPERKIDQGERGCI